MSKCSGEHQHSWGKEGHAHGHGTMWYEGDPNKLHHHHDIICLRAKDAEIARLTTENKRFRQERDDQFWARGHELKELIAARTALDEANRKYERAYDCHGQACGACIACCAEIIYDLTIRKDMAREDGYRQGWEHCKQVQDSFNEATIAVSRKFQEDLLEILTIVENDNDPDWSKVQKVKGIMLKHHIEEDEEMYDG